MRELHTLELVSQNRPCSIIAVATFLKRIGVNDEFGHSGPADALLKQFGLCSDHIVEVAKELCK